MERLALGAGSAADKAGATRVAPPDWTAKPAQPAVDTMEPQLAKSGMVGPKVQTACKASMAKGNVLKSGFFQTSRPRQPTQKSTEKREMLVADDNEQPKKIESVSEEIYSDDLD